MKKIYMIISNEYYMYLLYIYILTIIRYFYLFILLGVNLMFSSINMYSSYKYYSIVHVHFYSGNVRYESVVELVYIYHYFFVCTVKRVYFTAKKSVSNVVTCFSPTDGAQIVSNYPLLSTSDISLFDSNIQYLTTLISLFILPK